MKNYKIIKNADYQELQNELTRSKLVETSLRSEIARLKRDKEQLEIVRNNQYMKIDELNRDIEGYKEYLVPIEQMPLITAGYKPKGLGIDAVDYIANAENSVEIISYLAKETAWMNKHIKTKWTTMHSLRLSNKRLKMMSMTN